MTQSASTLLHRSISDDAANRRETVASVSALAALLQATASTFRRPFDRLGSIRSERTPRSLARASSSATSREPAIASPICDSRTPPPRVIVSSPKLKPAPSGRRRESNRAGLALVSLGPAGQGRHLRARLMGRGTDHLFAENKGDGLAAVHGAQIRAVEMRHFQRRRLRARGRCFAIRACRG